MVILPGKIDWPNFDLGALIFGHTSSTGLIREKGASLLPQSCKN